MAAGQKLDATYWHPTFKTAKGQEFLDSVYHMTGTYVRCDWEHNCIAASGRAEAIEAAKSSLREEIQRISAMQWTIPLQHRALGFFVRKGLAKMKALLGEENVVLDGQTCTIVLHVAKLEEARHHLNQLMDEYTDRNTTSIDTSADTRALCPICHDTISQPIQTSCEHIYCSSCLHHYILSTLDNRNFPLKCMGGDTTVCNQPLSIPLIKEFLSPHQFKQMVEAAFTSYIDKNPETFKHCNTPDCTQIYRTTTLPQELQCPSCFSEICTACNEEGHAGMTCAERRAHKDPGEQERLFGAWVAENLNNVKRCPSCRAWVEKMEGCNDMSCNCGAHLRWIYSGVFNDGMSPAHGGTHTNPGSRGQVLDVAEITGGPAAVAERMPDSRLPEFQRENRMEPALLVRLATPTIPAQPLVRAAPTPAHSLKPDVPVRPAVGSGAPLAQLPKAATGQLGNSTAANVVLDPGREEAERRRREELMARQRIQQDELERTHREDQERRREQMEYQAAQQRQQENARRREIYEALREQDVRRRQREAEGNRCTIM
ncbi:hypothetical protein P691DRAFT_808539 [Macrolepiota fuliginosa MF-IS2]|uniref:RBR-type E3 ubiquitin transferase n=1 Tax=Macrolepiota fuliginosa MF-IS2 TaxID=1400762 RepID=A0A9P5XP66_9AGAR|nr:hypothetical protein P691DRAFT_808539 [Macrolepiota fuliginosa MF-IS2]